MQTHKNQGLFPKRLQKTMSIYQQLTNFRLPNSKFADDNFEFEKNGRKIFKGVENAVEKGEIARYEKVLLFPECFQKTCLRKC